MAVKFDVKLEFLTLGVAGAQFEMLWLAMGFTDGGEARLIGRAQRNQRVRGLMRRRLLGMLDDDGGLALVRDPMNLDFGRLFLACANSAAPFGPKSARILPCAVARTKRWAKTSAMAPVYSTV
jgi:hypothetical protein